MKKDRNATICEVSKAVNKDVETVTEYFDYLDECRKLGQTKFYGGIPKLMEKYNKLTRKEATTVVVAWMEVIHGK